MLDLTQSARNHGLLRQRLAEAFGLDEHDEAIQDTLDGESDFKEMAVKVLRYCLEREAMAEAMDAIIEANKARKARHKDAATKGRALIAEAMIEAGEAKIIAPDMTISVRMGSPRKIIDVDTLPFDFREEVVTYKPKRDLIDEACANGDVPEGVTITNGSPVLTVRSK